MTRWIAGVTVALLLLLVEGAAKGAPFELHGYLSFIEADHQGFIEHRYAWSLEPGAGIRAELEADFEPYLEIVDERGELVARADDNVDVHIARLGLESGKGGPYFIRVTSTSGDETGAYTLRLWPVLENLDALPGVEPPRPVPPSRSDIVDRGALFESEIQSGFVDFAGQIARHAISAPPGGGVFDVWLFSDHDFDLYGAVLQGGAVIFDTASKRAYGYEHVRLVAPEGDESIVIHVALFEPYTEVAPYHLLVRRQAVEGSVQVDPGEAPSLARDMPYAGRLAAGERVGATIHPASFTTQSWTFYVPPGTRHIEIGLFDADRDLELSVEPGWTPSPYGMEHRFRSATRRWNDRIVIDADLTDEETSDLPPGIYTVAVWPAGAEAQAEARAEAPAEEHWARGRGESPEVRYSIQLEVERRLPPSSAYVGFTDEALEAMQGAERARLATVWIESDFHWGVGALVSPEGLILTNYSAVYDCHPDLSAPVGCIGDGIGPRSFESAEEYLVWTLDRASGLARQQFVAEVIAALPRYDLALLKIVRDVDGNPAPDFAAGNVPRFPYLRLGVTERSPGPPVVTALGFPEGAWSGRFVARPIATFDVTVHDRPFPLFEIDGRDPRWQSGALLVAPEYGVLLGLITQRQRLHGADESWVAVPTELVPAQWLTSAHETP